MSRRNGYRPNALNLQSKTVSVRPEDWVRLEPGAAMVACPHCTKPVRGQVFDCILTAVCDECKNYVRCALEGFGGSPVRYRHTKPTKRDFYRPEDDTH
jgi:hypothetical protein